MKLGKMLVILFLTCVGIIFTISIFESWGIPNHSNSENFQVIPGDDVPKVNVSFHEITYLVRSNMSELDVKSFTELKIDVSSQKGLKLYGKKILVVRNVKESDVGRISLIYPKGVVLDNITAKNARIKNISIATTPQADILILVLKTSQNNVGTIAIEYHAKLTRFEPFISYVGMKDGWSIFRTTYDGSELVLSSMWLLREVEVFKSYESQIRLEIPKGWRGVVIDEKGEGFWESIHEESADERAVFVYYSKNSRNPVIIAGNFSCVSNAPSGVSLDIYQVGKRRKDVLFIASEVLEDYSKLLGGYPYSDLRIIYLESLGTRGGFEFPRGVILINPKTNGTLILAHEIAHSWFGDYASFGRMDETLANYLALTYTNFPELLNFTEHSPLINSAYSLKQVYQEEISNAHAEGMIYYKGASVFRSLQFVLGNETFFRSIRELLRGCHGRECNLTDVLGVFERVSDQNLDWFFKEWFYTTKVPEYEVENLSIEQKDGKYLLSFEIIDKNNFTMPLEIEVITTKEKAIKKVWVNGGAKVSFELEGKPTAILLDPNEWMVNENRNYTVNGIKIRIE
ncbi:M1 family aminopeptidase [Thermococcus sp. 5-4]|uniref:M1 family aminopeptidase n=1 Tax=Thermococcus sp. 5-4 TaxID=2008440 RepID=UPI000B4A21C5|nr:M1 family aminopeptidase [Thermococcus sp. 5-4]ASA76776.1 aminopeptidase [Thermococcus sp. 5-4]